MHNEPIGLKQIAAKAGVSAMTVSRVMRGHPNVSETTSERIKAIADELGYRSNRMARSMKSGKSGIVGFIMPEKHATGSEILNGVYSFFHEKDMMLSLDLVSSNTGPTAFAEQTKQINRLLEIRVDGIIILPVSEETDEIYYKELLAKNIPVVCVDREIKDVSTHFVGTDDLNGGEQAAIRLYRAGCRRTLIISAGDGVSVSRMRHEGFISKAKELNLDVISHLECPTFRYNAQLIYNEVKRQKGHFDSIFAVADRMAMSAWISCNELNIRVPEEVKIIGFGRSDISDPRFKLSTFDQGPKQIGLNAASLLNDCIVSDSSEKSIHQPKLILCKPQFTEGLSCPYVE